MFYRGDILLLVYIIVLAPMYLFKEIKMYMPVCICLLLNEIALSYVYLMFIKIKLTIYVLVFYHTISFLKFIEST